MFLPFPGWLHAARADELPAGTTARRELQVAEADLAERHPRVLRIVEPLGILCVLVAMIAILGHWVIAAVALGIGALVVLLWGLIGGTGSQAVLDADRADADLERAKTAQYMMRSKSQPPGGGL